MRRFLPSSLLMLAAACSSQPPTSPETPTDGAHAASATHDEQPARPGTRVVAPRTTVQTVSLGGWGGVHVSLLLTATGGTLEYDCAHGTIDQPFDIDSAGRFQLAGTHTREHGGPIRKDEKPDTHPARYNGAVDGDTMTAHRDTDGFERGPRHFHAHARPDGSRRQVPLASLRHRIA